MVLKPSSRMPYPHPPPPSPPPPPGQRPSSQRPLINSQKISPSAPVRSPPVKPLAKPPPPPPPIPPHRASKPPLSHPSKVVKPQGSTFDGKHISAKKAASFLHSAQKNRQTISQSLATANPTTRVVSKTSLNSSKSEPNWNPKHFRLFVGNLGPDATDELLRSAFIKYATLSNVYVPMDKATKKPKGFGFVAFASADDYLQAFKDMNGKYIGQYPVQLKRAESSVPKKHKNKK